MAENTDNEAIPLQPVTPVTRGKRGSANHVVHILSEEPNPYLQDLGLTSVFKPILYSSIGFGLVWKRNTTKWFDIHTVHSCVLLLLLWFQTLRYFPAYGREDKYGTVLFQKIVVHIWCSQCTFGITVYLYSKYRNFPSFIRQWENYKIKYGGLTLSFMKKHIFHRVAIINVIAITFMLISAVIWITFRPVLFTKWLFPSLSKTDKNEINIGLFVLHTFLLVYGVLVWFQCALNTLCYCSLLKLEFNILAKQLSDSVHCKTAHRRSVVNLNTADSSVCNDNGPTASNVTPTHKNECEHYRNRYVCLCKLVQKLDDVLNGYLLILYLFAIPMIILLLYAAWDKGSYAVDKLSISLGINSLIFFAVLIVSVTSAANSLAVAARKVSQVLNSIDLSSYSLEETVSVQIFLQKIHNDHTGLTIWKIINIDCNLLITIATIIITYVALLFKFALALGGK